ncbi:hypothetical protein CYY_004861 [Polysphondylium violaceum]|uniref:Fatty acid hydroxylase domain-containing protein n=1 Tax=Polysphondylium violaceum TaxID=133409 RepID=A0A8J4PW44_9MYCE|nr:hypothetical protein CYY_004861 [Polysphondylium violaceum]
MVSINVLGEDYHDYISDAIPYFILFMGIELVVSIYKKKVGNIFSVSDSISSLSTGMSTLVLERLMPKGILSSIEFIGALYVYKNYRLLDTPEDSSLVWFISLILIDFCYYWFHRMAHEVNFLWSTHVTHHSSEKYNFTTALRQNIFQIYTSWIFFVPLGLIMPPKIYMFHKQFNTIAQFWIHTQAIDKMPYIVELIFNTPSHHRVHHGRNPKYLDKNYAGILIIWDRIFGTFEPEIEKPFYGLVHPLDSHDPTYSQVHNWFDMYEKSKKYKSISDKLKVFFYGPGWDKGLSRMGDSSMAPQPNEKEQKQRDPIPHSNIINVYIFTHYMVVSLTGIIMVSHFEEQVGSLNISLFFAFIYLSLTSFGAIFDRKRYAFHLELFRNILFIVATSPFTSATIQYFKVFYSLSLIFLIGKIFYPVLIKKLN